MISVGNLRVGGSGKTPLVAHIAKLLLDEGQRPSILTRGYGRRTVTPGVTIVSNGQRRLADLDSAGDEPLLLARQLPQVLVLVGSDRYESGRLAETTLGATVHILDDGFQHLKLARGTDLLMIDRNDLTDRPMPAGHLRESIAAASSADAVLVLTDSMAEAETVGRACGVSPVFRVTRSLGAPRMVSDLREPAIVPPGARVFAVAGIARPERFFADLSSIGFETAGTMTFRDHHPFTAQDVERILAAANSASATIVLTTEKDAVRLRAVAQISSSALPFAFIPLEVSVEPPGAFRQWLVGRLR